MGDSTDNKTAFYVWRRFVKFIAVEGIYRKQARYKHFSKRSEAEDGRRLERAKAATAETRSNVLIKT